MTSRRFSIKIIEGCMFRGALCMPKKQTSDRVSSLAAKGLAGKRLTREEQMSVYASLLGQDETPGLAQSKKAKTTTPKKTKR
jgi:hypothetical protein